MKLSRKEQVSISIIIILFFAYILILNNIYIESQHEELLQHIAGLENQIGSLQELLSQEQMHNTELQTEKVLLMDEIEELQRRIDNLSGVKPSAPANKTVYLTFDDGPSANTTRILNILAKYNIPATFFVNGRDTNQYDYLYKKIVDDGHALGNHTYSHIYTDIYASVDAFMEDIYKLDNLIYRLTGTNTKIVRFPGGTSTGYTNNTMVSKIIKRLLSEGYQYFDWNVDSKDSAVTPAPAEELAAQVVNDVRYKKTAIVLLHDLASKQSTVEALPLIIEQLSALGYSFDKLDVDSYYIHHR